MKGIYNNHFVLVEWSTVDRKKMNINLQFVAFRGKSFSSKMIRFWTRSEYSHIAISIGDDKLIEAWGKGLTWKYSSLGAHSQGTPYEVWSLPVIVAEWDQCMLRYHEMAESNLPYDRIGIIGFVLKTRRDDKLGMFCSEGAIAPIIEVRNLDINPAHISPEDLIRLIKFAGGTMEKEGTV